MDLTRKLSIRTSGLNAQLLNHATSKRHSLPFSQGVIDGIDHAPAYQALPPAIYKVAASSNDVKPVRTNFFTDLFAARKADQE